MTDGTDIPLADPCAVCFAALMRQAGSIEEMFSMVQDAELRLYRLALEALNSVPCDRVRNFTGQFSADADLVPYQTDKPRPEIDLPVSCHATGQPFGHLCSAFVELYDKVAWGDGYSEDDLGGVVNLGGWVPLASSEGPIVAENALLALTVLNMRAYYPPHRHPPEELYLTISGGFWFERQGMEAVWVGPRDIVFTERNQIHALRGGDASTLMIACWANGSYQKSELIH